MELLSQIEARAQAARERAWQREKLLNEATTLERSLTTLRAMPLDVQPLAAMRDALAQIPSGLLTRGGRFLPGGFDVKTLVGDILDGAIADLTIKAAKRDEAVKTAETRLAAIRKALVTQ